MRKIVSGENIAIVGAGLVGSLLAIYMSRRGFKVSLFEKRSDSRFQGDGKKRSINLALSDRGWNALNQIGLDGDLRKMALPMYGRMIHSNTGELTFQPYNADGKAIFSISRKLLNDSLLNFAAKDDYIDFKFNHRFADFDLDLKTVRFYNEETSSEYDFATNVLFGTDGCFSEVRRAIDTHVGVSTPVKSNTHGYKQLVIPASPEGDWLIAPDALHIWPRGQFMLIALPNIDKTFTCTIFLPQEGEQSLQRLSETSGVSAFFEKEFPDVMPLIPDLANVYLDAPVCGLFSVDCEHWTAEGFVTLLGDAAHSILPFYGQGMNAGFEDCALLMEKLDHAICWEELFRDFEESRKPDTDAIASLSMHNFQEMQEKVADKNFLLRKEIENHLSKNYAESWVSQYSLVSFSNVPYRVALETGYRQEVFLDEIMSLNNIEDSWLELDYQVMLDKQLNSTASIFTE